MTTTKTTTEDRLAAAVRRAWKRLPARLYEFLWPPPPVLLVAGFRDNPSRVACYCPPRRGWPERVLFNEAWVGRLSDAGMLETALAHEFAHAFARRYREAPHLKEFLSTRDTEQAADALVTHWGLGNMAALRRFISKN